MKITYENRLEDILNAIEVVDARGTASRRKIFWFLGCVMVLYWFIPPVFSAPTVPLNWVMAAIAIGLTVYVWKGPDMFNKRFAKQYAATSPTGCAEIDDNGILIEDGYGASTLLYADGINVYEYKNVLAISTAKQKMAVIPLRNLDEEQRDECRAFLREKLDARFEKVDSLKNGNDDNKPFSKMFKGG